MIVSSATMTFGPDGGEVEKAIDMFENVETGDICTKAGHIIQFEGYDLYLHFIGQPDGSAKLEIDFKFKPAATE